MSLQPISECDPILKFHDIVSWRHDIVSKFTISGPILAISGPISCTYRVHTVSRHTRYFQYRARYRVFFRYRARYRVHIVYIPLVAIADIVFFTDIGPDMDPILQTISQYTEIMYKKTRHRPRCVCNITIYGYRVLSDVGAFTWCQGRYVTCCQCASAPRRPHWPGAPTGPASESAQALQLEQARSTVEFSSLLEM
jgi:hypothetical protein